MTKTDKWTSEIDLSFGIKTLQNPNSVIYQKIDLSLLQMFIQKRLFFLTLYDSSLVPD